MDIPGLAQRHPYLSEYTLNKIYLKDTLAKKLYFFFKAVNLSKNTDGETVTAISYIMLVSYRYLKQRILAV